MNEHLRSVDALPPEIVVRKLVDQVPGYVLRDEAGDADVLQEKCTEIRE